MPRVIMDSSGFKVGKIGVNAATAAEADLLFSSSSAGLIVYSTGIVTLTDVSTFGETRYRRGIVTFGKTFSAPPIIFAAAIINSTKVSCSILSCTDEQETEDPDIYIRTSTTQCEINVLRGDKYRGGPNSTTARYYIMENTLI